MTVVPDSIEPVEEWRTWKFYGGRLVSHNGAVWEPGEPHKAKCDRGDRHYWAIERGSGMTREQAAKHAEQYNSHSLEMARFIHPPQPRHWLRPPRVEAPEGYCYVLKAVTHAAPDADCTCGIYAARTPTDCPSGDVLGKVKLWGTIVPGTKGSRAEFAYPSELHVPAKLVEDPALLSYGVPVVAVGKEELAAAVGSLTASSGVQRLRLWLCFAIAVNVVVALVNLTLIALRAA